MSAYIPKSLPRAGWSVAGCLKWNCILMLAGLVAGCKTPCYEESFSIPFDAAKVAQLSHESYKVAWNVEYWARMNLYYAPFHPKRLDWEAVLYMRRLREQVPWIALDIEKNPATARCSSKKSYDIVAFDAKMLKRRYQPASFRPSTDANIEKLLSLLDQISAYYEPKKH